MNNINGCIKGNAAPNPLRCINPLALLRSWGSNHPTAHFYRRENYGIKLSLYFGNCRTGAVKDIIILRTASDYLTYLLSIAKKEENGSFTAW
jgi:hypothetical protein